MLYQLFAVIQDGPNPPQHQRIGPPDTFSALALKADTFHLPYITDMSLKLVWLHPDSVIAAKSASKSVLKATGTRVPAQRAKRAKTALPDLITASDDVGAFIARTDPGLRLLRSPDPHYVPRQRRDPFDSNYYVTD